LKKFSWFYWRKWNVHKLWFRWFHLDLIKYSEQLIGDVLKIRPRGNELFIIFILYFKNFHEPTRTENKFRRKKKNLQSLPKLHSVSGTERGRLDESGRGFFTHDFTWARDDHVFLNSISCVIHMNPYSHSSTRAQ